MHIPILKQRNCLIASIQAAVSDEDLVTLREQLIQQVGQYRSAGIILDVTGLDVLDSFSVRILRDMALIMRLRGANTAIVGIQPNVALTMVQQGLTLEGIYTALDLEEGLAYFDAREKYVSDYGIPDAQGNGSARR